MKRIIEFLAKPLNNHLSICILLLLFIASADIYYFINNGHFIYSFYILLQGIVLAYVVTLSISHIKFSIIRNILYVTFLSILIFIFILDIFCLTTYDVRFNKDFAAIILQTNLNETFEFLNKYVTSSIIYIIISVALLTTIIYYISRYNLYFKLLLKYVYTFLLLCSIPLTVRNYGVYSDGWISKITCFRTAYIPDLKTTFKKPDIKITNSHLPPNIVLIIGESYNKHHSSLYGYHHITNPQLSLLKDSLLYVFNNVTSPATHTIASFQCILNTYKPEYKDSLNWYNTIHLHEILSSINYKTYWISNQSENGMLDNVASAYGSLCDEKHFIRKKFQGGGWNTYDEKILELIKPLSIKNDTLSFFFIHLLGSHPDFKQRYPKQYYYFTPYDYKDRPLNQRQTLAEYDNSILYNDFIIYEIINIFKDKEAIIIYTSDHGLDIFQTDNNYAGHAKINNIQSVKYGSEIPFIIYTSPTYKKKYPQVIKAIEKSLNNYFRTDNLIYTIMDIIGVSFNNNSDISHFSLLKGIYHNTRYENQNN